MGAVSARRDGVDRDAAASEAVDAGSLRLLACVAAAVLVISLVVLVRGVGEQAEGLSWVLAFAIGLPAGLLAAARQERQLAGAAPAAAARGVALGALVLALGLVGRRLGSAQDLWHALLALAALIALLVPFAAARCWRRTDDRRALPARVLTVAATLVAMAIFVPAGARTPPELLIALLLALGTVALLRSRPSPPPPLWRDICDLLIALALILFVVQLPQLPPFAGDTLLHHDFFLGPANDVVHGRAMVAEAWSQYGVGLIDALGAVFLVVPIGYGSLALIVIALTVAQYLCVLAVLRLAGVGQLLTVAALAVAVLGNLFATLDYYMVFPSASPLRFGLPYLIVLAAVLGARLPGRRRAGEIAMLAILALSSIWSFETLAYTAGAYGSMVLVEALAARSPRVLVVAVARAVAVCVAAVLAFSLTTLALAGNLDWAPYVEYLREYSAGGVAQLPLAIFSAGPLMGLAIFASGAMALWLAQSRPEALAPPMRAAIAGLTGFAIVSFTYYIGRSHPNNLLILLVPVVAVGALWGQVLLDRARGSGALLAGGALALAGAMIAVSAWPSLEAKYGDTAIGLVAPGGRSPVVALEELSENPVLQPQAPYAVEMLDRHLSPGEPALVLAGARLSTEILLRSGRPNLLPISDSEQDELIDSSVGRVRAASAEVPAGTLLLRTGPLVGELDRTALATLRRRFRLVRLEVSPAGFELDRLAPRR